MKINSSKHERCIDPFIYIITYSIDIIHMCWTEATGGGIERQGKYCDHFSILFKTQTLSCAKPSNHSRLRMSTIISSTGFPRMKNFTQDYLRIYFLLSLTLLKGKNDKKIYSTKKKLLCNFCVLSGLVNTMWCHSIWITLSKERHIFNFDQ